jgi:hypothetical protein
MLHLLQVANCTCIQVQRNGMPVAQVPQGRSVRCSKHYDVVQLPLFKGMLRKLMPPGVSSQLGQEHGRVHKGGRARHWSLFRTTGAGKPLLQLLYDSKHGRCIRNSDASVFLATVALQGLDECTVKSLISPKLNTKGCTCEEYSKHHLRFNAVNILGTSRRVRYHTKHRKTSMDRVIDAQLYIWMHVDATGAESQSSCG